VMREQKSGVIVNVSSLAAVSPFTGFSAYGGSKAWLETVTKAWADEGRGHGIRVFVVRPGAVTTPLPRRAVSRFSRRTNGHGRGSRDGHQPTFFYRLAILQRGSIYGHTSVTADSQRANDNAADT